MNFLRVFVVAWAVLLTVIAQAADKVVWTANLPDAKGVVTLHAEIQKGWHLYSTTKTDGPVPTTIKALPPLSLAGPIVQSTPVKKLDPNFNANVEYYSGSADFQVPVKGDASKGKLTVEYQICSDNTCEPPKTVEVNLTGEASKEVVKTVSSDGRERGFWGFVGFAFTAGLLALLTPCVFPMVPITVSFFAKRKAAQGSKAGLAQAAAYCGGIIGAFTGFGLIITILFGAGGIQTFATNPFVNLALAAIFIVLALSLFGMLQLNLPSKLTNAFQPQGKQGLLAPLLMGLTFTLTSFTCTVPFVGTILVSATKGDFLYPFVGMLAFSSAFALPFFLLALFPQALASLPKSGSWLDMMKAFMGFLEIAAAMKFLSNADLVLGTNLISRSTFLGVWALVLVLAALFLLRIIRLPNLDLPKKIGAGRIVTVGASLAAAGWFLTGISGNSLGEIEAFLPPDAGGWPQDFDRAVAASKAQGKPILIDFSGVSCTNCRWMEKNMLNRPEVESQLKNFVLVKLLTDRDIEGDRRNQKLQQQLTNSVTLPVYVQIDADQKVLKIFQGSTRNPAEYLTFLGK
jgi:thiol:disulfide interchange protein